MFPTTDSTSGASSAINAVAAIFKVETAGIAETNPNVIFAAATNYPERVDPTLIRSGRFDLHLTVGLPNEVGRHHILINLIAKAQQSRMAEMLPDTPPFPRFSTEFEQEATINTLARASNGLSPADIHNLLGKVLLRKADDEAKGLAVTPVSLGDMLSEISMLGSRNAAREESNTRTPGQYL